MAVYVDLGRADLARFGNMLGGLGKDAPKVMARAVNRAGDMARTQMVRALARQTGLPQKTIRRAVKVRRAGWDDPVYELVSAGGDVSLKYFRKRETDDGVAAKLGEARGTDWFAESFLRGGRWPGGRVDLERFHGHVMVRVGNRGQLEKVTSGVIIPEEMVRGASALAFERVVHEVLPRRLDHEIGRALGL